MEAELNTDKELWRETEGDYYADSIHVTKDGYIGINVGGLVRVLTLRQWHEFAAAAFPHSPFNKPNDKGE